MKTFAISLLLAGISANDVDNITGCIDGIATAAAGMIAIDNELDMGIEKRADDVLRKQGEFNVPDTLMSQVQAPILDVKRNVELLKNEQKLWVHGLQQQKLVNEKKKVMYIKYHKHEQAAVLRKMWLTTFNEIHHYAVQTSKILKQAETLGHAIDYADGHLKQVTGTLLTTYNKKKSDLEMKLENLKQ